MPTWMASWASKAGCVTSAVLRLRAQHLFEAPAGARQPRHDRAYGHARHPGDLLVGQLLQLSQHDHLAELRRQLINRAMQRDALALRYHGCFRILARHCLAVLLLIELGRERVAMMTALPGVSRVARSEEQPCPPLKIGRASCRE